MYSVKLEKIEFIYNDYIYCIVPLTVGATMKSQFSFNNNQEIECDSLFEKYQKEIRDDLAKQLGVVYSKYTGFLD